MKILAALLLSVLATLPCRLAQQYPVEAGAHRRARSLRAAARISSPVSWRSG